MKVRNLNPAAGIIPRSQNREETKILATTSFREREREKSQNRKLQAINQELTENTKIYLRKEKRRWWENLKGTIIKMVYYGLTMAMIMAMTTTAFEPSVDPAVQWPAGELNCAHGMRTFDPLTQKRTYYVGVHATAGVETARREFNLTFEEYLTRTVGARWDQPLTFKMKVTTDPLRDWVDNEEEVDFMYSDTGLYSCIGVEIGGQPLGTTISHLTVRGKSTNLDGLRRYVPNKGCERILYGNPATYLDLYLARHTHSNSSSLLVLILLASSGSIIVREDNDAIQSVSDLRDRIIAAQSISDFSGAQVQFYTMHKKGLDYIMDPKQVIFTGTP